MNIVVIAGSPKGEKSVTMQYVNYLQQRNPQHSFTVHHVAQQIKALEKNPEGLEAVLEDIREAQGVLWAFPLYFALVHAGYKRFIELIFEQNRQQAFAGKHCAILTTSIHFFDHTAIEYVRGIGEDWGMSVDEVFSAAMDDLLTENGQKQLELFFELWCQKVEGGTASPRLSAPIVWQERKIGLPQPEKNVARYSSRLGLVTESGISENLDRMVEVFAKKYEHAQVYDLSQMKISGNCLGCLKCGYANQCVYEGKDDVIGVYRRLKECEVIVLAGSIHDRYLSARWKTFMDRMFFTTHIPLLSKKVMGLILCGPLRQIPNLRSVLTGFFETDELALGGIVTDEDDNTAEQLEQLAGTLERWSASGYLPPRQFPGLSGHKIFRDAIYEGLKGVFVADHKHYKKQGLYDFPQRNLGKRITSGVMYLGMKVPAVRREIRENMADYMIRPYQRIVLVESTKEGKKKPLP